MSKIDTMVFLKWMKESNVETNYIIDPVSGQEAHQLRTKELSKKIIDQMESDGDFYDTLRANNLL